MELVFVQSPSGWECEVKVTAEFNLHIERGGVGRLLLYQNTPGGGKYDRVEDFKVGDGDMVIDYDSGSFIAPKTIKIESSVEPTYAALTTDGEVTEIKSQSKEVEVTSNGTTNVTPDAGYSYLSGVSVKVNVPQEGGGGSTMEYIDVSGVSDLVVKASVVQCATYVKAYVEDYNAHITGVPLFVVSAVSSNPIEKVSAIAIDFSNLNIMKMGDTVQSVTVAEAVLQNGATQADIDAIPRITKEEFYNIA